MKWWLIIQSSTLKLIGLSLILGTDFNGLGWILFFSGGGVVIAHIFLPRAQGLCDVITTFEPEGKEIWLTIDDGPDSEDTPSILEVLAEYGAHATFFMIGEKAACYPEGVDRVIAAGHSIGTHTQTHPLRTYWAAGRIRVARELDDSLAILAREKHRIALYRSPVGIKNFFLRRILIERRLRCVAWSIRSGDTFGRSVEAITQRVENELRPGSILLMHEGCRLSSAVRVEALRAVLAMLSRQGYRCVLPEPSRYIT